MRRRASNFVNAMFRYAISCHAFLFVIHSQNVIPSTCLTSIVAYFKKLRGRCAGVKFEVIVKVGRGDVEVEGS